MAGLCHSITLWQDSSSGITMFRLYKVREILVTNELWQWIRCVLAGNMHNLTKTNQHYLAMKLLERQLAASKGDGASTYTPIAHANGKNTHNPAESARLRHKLDIAHLVANEKLLFEASKYLCTGTRIWELP